MEDVKAKLRIGSLAQRKEFIKKLKSSDNDMKAVLAHFVELSYQDYLRFRHMFSILFECNPKDVETLVEGNDVYVKIPEILLERLNDLSFLEGKERTC